MLARSASRAAVGSSRSSFATAGSLPIVIGDGAGPTADNCAVSEPSAQQRRLFLDERRASGAHRSTTLYSATYDAEWGEIWPVHERFVRSVVALVPAGGSVLDAACGTGKYWPMLLAAGLAVTGIDQSTGLLAQATATHPGVPTHTLALPR